MNSTENVQSFRRLDREIEAGEAANEEKRWEQARLAAVEAGKAGMGVTAFAREVGKHHSTISRYARAWERWGGAVAHGRPRFVDAFAMVQTGSDDVTSHADLLRQRRERQEPTAHEDRVEMFRKLAADREVVEEVVAADRQAATVMDHVIYEHNTEARTRRADEKRRRDEASGLPLSAHTAAMHLKIREWTRSLANIYDDLGDIPPGRSRELVGEAYDRLAEEAIRGAVKLGVREGSPGLEEGLPVIEIEVAS